MKPLFTLLFSLFTLFATAQTQPFCGNGNTVVEYTNPAKSNFTISHKNLFPIVEISLPDTHIESFDSDISTGEITSHILNSKGRFQENIFASRKDDFIAIKLTATEGTINQKIKFHTPTNHNKKNDFSQRLVFTAAKDGIIINSTFNKPVADGENMLSNSHTIVKVLNEGGKRTITNEEITLTKCKQALILISNSQSEEHLTYPFDLESDKNTHPEEIYSALFKANLPLHNTACKTVSLTLNTGKDIDNEISQLYNKLYYKGICYGSIQNIELDNFSALPKLSNLTQAQIQSSFYFDYYLYTLDTDFLRDKVMPYMMNTFEILEKTLKATDDFGFYIVGKDCPTIDVTASIFFLRDLETACNVLMQYQERVPRIQEMLAKLPPYKIDINEDFRRNLYGEINNKTNYTEVSHLLGLFYRNDPIITRNYDIRQSCSTSIQNCIANRQKLNITGIDTGFLQLALSSAALGDSETAYRLLCGAREGWEKAGSRELVPIIKKMLVQSYYSPESSRTYINILPAVPETWNKGELTGMPVRGGLTIQNLSWNENGDTKATIVSKTEMTIDVYVRGHFIKQFSLTPGTPQNIVVRKK